MLNTLGLKWSIQVLDIIVDGSKVMTNSGTVSLPLPGEAVTTGRALNPFGVSQQLRCDIVPSGDTKTKA